jgi:hypothetical protein
MPRGPVVAVLLLSTLLTSLASPARAAEPVEALLRQRAEAFVAAMNAGDRSTLEAFARDHLESRVAREGQAGRFAERMQETRAELGAIERHSVQVLRAGALVFVYCKHAKSGSWQNYQFRVVAGDVHRRSSSSARSRSSRSSAPAPPSGRTRRPAGWGGSRRASRSSSRSRASPSCAAGDERPTAW